MPEVKAQTLVVNAAIDGEIRRHGEETYPHECCGALVGTGNRVTATVALPNTTEEGPRRRFMVRPSDYRVAEQKAAELGGDLLGFYHSHPDHPARPSQYRSRSRVADVRVHHRGRRAGKVGSDDRLVSEGRPFRI